MPSLEGPAVALDPAGRAGEILILAASPAPPARPARDGRLRGRARQARRARGGEPARSPERTGPLSGAPGTGTSPIARPFGKGDRPAASRRSSGPGSVAGRLSRGMSAMSRGADRDREFRVDVRHRIPTACHPGTWPCLTNRLPISRRARARKPDISLRTRTPPRRRKAWADPLRPAFGEPAAAPGPRSYWRRT
jgi:hypothetical protein